jgi:glyoxylase-like metal-dependent hydrolase (beta-lactamase superfamily II)
MVELTTLLQGYRLGTDQGDIAFCGVNLIEGPDESGALRRIVVDTGHTGRRTALEAVLRQRGLSPDDIDTVVCTHAHWDHVENLNIFSRARIVIHETELRYITQPHRNDFGCPEWIHGIFGLYKDRVTEVDEGTVLIPGVEVINAPGHSAGTIAISARTDEGTAVITGDSIQNSLVAVHRKNALVFWNDEQATRTIDKLLAVGDVIYPGHDQAFRILPGNQVEYVQPLRLALTKVSPEEPGLTFAPDGGLQQVIMPGIEEQRLPVLPSACLGEDNYAGT